MRKVITKDPNKKQSPASIIGGILFLIVFIGSIIAMYIASQTDTYLCLVIVFGFFGFMFLLAGFQHIKRLNVGNLVFLTVGLESLIGMFVAYRLRYGDVGQKDRMLEAAPTLGCLGCALFGLVLLFGGIMTHRLKEKRCSQEITAEVIEKVVTFTSTNNMTHKTQTRYAPRVKYEWFGNEYETQAEVRQSEQDFEIGDTMTIYINPEDPEDAYFPGRSAVGGSLIFGIIFLAAAVLVYALLHMQ